MNRKMIILYLMIGVGMSQFSDVEVSLDLRNISKKNHLLLNDFKKEVSTYFESNIFSEEDIDLDIPIKIHVVVESINKRGPQTIRAQIFTSNNLDLNLYSKSCYFPYSKGESINHTSTFDPLSSLFNYFAYIFLANELDMYSALGGNSFLNKAEKISIEGKESNYSTGWDDRWKKARKINENVYLRKLRYHLYEIKYQIQESQKDNQEVISYLASEIENDIYYLKEFFPNDRNVFLFLDIHADLLSRILKRLEMYDTLIMLKKYDVDNKLIYSKAIDK